MNSIQELLISRARARAIKRPGVWIPCDVAVATVDLRPFRIDRLPRDRGQVEVRWLPKTKQYEQRTVRLGRRRPQGIFARLAMLIPRIVIEGAD